MYLYFSGDDDINDVAAMGGVNLAEETQRILGSTEFVGTQIRSVKDEMFLHSSVLQQKIKQIRELIDIVISKLYLVHLLIYANQK
jgi:hypothetical protein